MQILFASHILNLGIFTNSNTAAFGWRSYQYQDSSTTYDYITVALLAPLEYLISAPLPIATFSRFWCLDFISNGNAIACSSGPPP